MTRQMLWKATLLMTLVVLSLFGILLGIAWRRHQTRRATPHLTVEFINVGNGDSTLIITPDKRTILIDTGSERAADKLALELKKHSIQRIDLLILASPRESSIGGVEALVDSGVIVQTAWTNTVRFPFGPEHNAKLALRRHGIQVRPARANVGIALGSSPMKCTILWPLNGGPRAQLDALVCRIDFGENSFLLAGGLTAASEPYLVSGAGDRLSCDVLHVPDQGADGSALPEFLRQAGPSHAIISCATEFPPAPSTLHMLEAAGTALWRTDLQGSVTVYADGKGPLSIVSERL